MKSFPDILQTIEKFHELSETILAANFAVEQYNIKHPNFKGFELREKAKAEYILMTTEGAFGEQQIIRIPENTFEFDFVLMLNLITHEMIHVSQKDLGNFVYDRNEREWQAYYEMIFHKTYPQIPFLPKHQMVFFGNKALEYYHKMGENSELQIKYLTQKIEVESFINLLQD